MVEFTRGERSRNAGVGCLGGDHGLVCFLLLPNVLLLPSVTLAKNCEHES